MTVRDFHAHLIEARETARTEDELLAALAHIVHYNRQFGMGIRDVGKLTCPSTEIPITETMIIWLPECSKAVRTKSNDSLTDLFGTIATWGVFFYLVRRCLAAAVEAGERNGERTALLVTMMEVNAAWLEARRDQPSLLHPLTILVHAWQRRAPHLNTATATVTDNHTNMTRRVQVVSTVRRVPWTLDAEVSGAVVDGEPMAAPRPDPAVLFPMCARRPRLQFRPGEQRTLNLPVVPPLQPDLRLLSLQDVTADPNSSVVLPGDVLTLLTLAHVADRPLILTEREGTALLVRDRRGKRRPVQRQHDMPRFWRAAARLRSLTLFDPFGSGRWVNLATIEVPRIEPVDRVIVGPPSWARGPNVGKWTLTAEGSAAALSRVTSGKQGLAGRVVTGIEYRLAAGWSGKPSTIAPNLRPANPRRKTGPGSPVFVHWRDVLRYAGDWWDETSPNEDEAARKRFDRVVATLEAHGYFVGDSPRNEAPAGDSVEIVSRVRGGRGRSAGLLVRASARFVEAARRAQLPLGAGFERMLLTDWMGLTLPCATDKDRPPNR